MEKRDTSGQLLDHLYIPGGERDLARFQHKVEKLDKAVRRWTAPIIDLLPKGLALLPEEVEILRLYLAEQRRKNLELDAGEKSPGLGRVIQLLANSNEHEMTRAAHQQVAVRIQSDIDQVFENYCRDRNIPMLESTLDWRVAIRLMAQRLYLVSSGNIKAVIQKPLRFEFALVARDHSLDVIGKRQRMMELLTPRS